MLKSGQRAEQQALAKHGLNFVIEEYLPSPLSADELANVVNTAIAQVAEQIGERPHVKHLGLVMKAATAIAGAKADGARLSAAVRQRL